MERICELSLLFTERMMKSKGDMDNLKEKALEMIEDYGLERVH